MGIKYELHLKSDHNIYHFFKLILELLLEDYKNKKNEY